MRAGSQPHSSMPAPEISDSHVRQLVEDAIYHAEHTASGIPEHHRGQAELSQLRSAEL